MRTAAAGDVVLLLMLLLLWVVYVYTDAVHMRRWFRVVAIISQASAIP
jgi:hypothetical protein